MTTRDRVIAAIAEALEVPAGEVRSESRFIDDLGATSLDIVNLIWRIEEIFALGETPESVLESIHSVGDLVAMVDGLRTDEPSEAVDSADILIASDHAGVDLKAAIVHTLRERGLAIVDLGPSETSAVDYPSFAEVLGHRIAAHGGQGILICGTGIGMSIAANKVHGIRAALANDPVSAAATRRHNDANVLCLGARIIGRDIAMACVDAFLGTSFDPGDDGRHQRRVTMIADIESTALSDS